MMTCLLGKVFSLPHLSVVLLPKKHVEKISSINEVHDKDDFIFCPGASQQGDNVGMLQLPVHDTTTVDNMMDG